MEAMEVESVWRWSRSGGDELLDVSDDLVVLA